MRIRCWLFGCAVHREYPACGHCQADLYGGPFIEVGKLEPAYRLRDWVRLMLRRIGPKKCDHCGKHYYRGYDEYMCSEECFNEWLPF